MKRTTQKISNTATTLWRWSVYGIRGNREHRDPLLHIAPRGAQPAKRDKRRVP